MPAFNCFTITCSSQSVNHPPKMSNFYFSDHRYNQQQSFSYPPIDRNIVPHMPYSFSSYFYLPDHFGVYGSVDSHLHHHLQPNTTFASQQPTTNPHGGQKAYFRLHGGIGGGCCSEACRNIQQMTAARPLQLFDAFDQIDHFQMPITRPQVPAAEGSSGTGVFLPVYDRKRIHDVNKNGMHVRGGRDDSWRRRHVQTKQEDDASSSRASVGGDVVEKKEPQDIKEEIPIELLLPSEWTY